MILYSVPNNSQFSMTSYKRLKPFLCDCRPVNILNLDFNNPCLQYIWGSMLLSLKLGQPDTKKTKICMKGINYCKQTVKQVVFYFQAV